MDRLLARAQLKDTFVWHYMPNRKFSVNEGLKEVLRIFNHAFELKNVLKFLYIQAGLGVGKTTLLPFLIQEIIKKPVVVAVPKELHLEHIFSCHKN